MKRWSTAVALAALLISLPFSAKAAELVTFALVDMIDNIAIVQDTALDFGGLIVDDGSVTVSANGLVTADVNGLVAQPTQVAGSFTVSATVGQQVEVVVSAPASLNGLSLSNFQWDIAGDTTSPVDIVNATEIMTLGATLTVDATTAVAGNDQQVPYTVTVQYP